MKHARRNRGLLGLIGAVTSAAGAFSGVRQAKEQRDNLVLANAVAEAIAAATGLLIIARALHRKRKLG
jgi:hypothetical protein